MAGECMSDEEILRTIPDETLALLSAEQRTALDRVLARLAAAEKVCAIIGDNLPPKRKPGDKGKRFQWWDAAIAVEEWEKVAKA